MNNKRITAFYSGLQPPREFFRQKDFPLLRKMQRLFCCAMLVELNYGSFLAEAMLLLLFHVGEDLYAIDTAPVVEILPMVLLRKTEPAPEHIAGVFNYRGKIVPVIDLCRLLRGEPCAACYSSRMIMVTYRIQSGASEKSVSEKSVSEKRDDRQRQFGLLVERVTETLKISPDQLKTAEQISDSAYLGELFVHERGMIQKVNWEQLITDADRAAGGRDRANGAERN